MVYIFLLNVVLLSLLLIADIAMFSSFHMKLFLRELIAIPSQPTFWRIVAAATNNTINGSIRITGIPLVNAPSGAQQSVTLAPGEVRGFKVPAAANEGLAIKVVWSGTDRKGSRSLLI